MVESQKSEELRLAVEGASLSVPDGMPLVWLLKRRGHPSTEKLTGIEFMPLLAEAGHQAGIRHYLYGGPPGVAAEAGRQLASLLPGTKVVGGSAPPFGPLESWDLADLEKSLLEVRPDVLWVGLGAPKQEIWMSQVADRLNVPLMIGVGAAFEFLAGTKSAAPRWMSNLGLEWFFRLVTEPRRLWRRYLLGNPRFVYLLGRETLLKNSR
jgi:N-acetylglucosaminyldiphosphoundecaprenol N-acetyl-beta-D-mannosaminyltransferase